MGDCSHAAQADGSPICVCRVHSLRVEDLTILGDAPLAILAVLRIEVTGTWRVTAGAVSFTGVAGNDLAGAGGQCRGSDTLEPLLGGEAGQPPCFSVSIADGVGALQLTAGERVVVSGRIDAAGEGGSGGQTQLGCAGGGGGGSGGGILIEAPEVSISGRIFAGGGGGGSGAWRSDSNGLDGSPGLSGGWGSTVQSGGHGARGLARLCSPGGVIQGGDGGNGAIGWLAFPEAGRPGRVEGCDAAHLAGGGGAGGAAGVIRINFDAELSPPNLGAQIAPPPWLGELHLR
jgi:hypothetical protein